MLDTHTHLHEMAQIASILDRARTAGVTGCVAVSMDLASGQRTLELADRFPEMVWPALGYHPWSIREEAIDRANFVLRLGPQVGGESGGGEL